MADSSTSQLLEATPLPTTPSPFSEPVAAGGEAPSSQPPSQQILYDLVIPLALLGVAVLIFLALWPKEAEKRADADLTRNGRLRALTPVRVEQLQSLESTGQQLKLEVDGNVVPFREAMVAAEVAGRVIFKDDVCEAGNFVKKDQLLMRIDPTDYELEVQRLSRLREQEYQALGEVDQEMINSQRLIEVAKQDVVLQQKEVDRQKALPKGFASPAEIDQANRALLAATQQLINAENQLDLLRKRRVRLEASERLAATQLKAAEVNLQRTEIRAPIAGVIVKEDADLNNFVARGNTLVTIEDISKVEVATNLRMDQLYWVLDQSGQCVDDSARGYDLPETPAIIEYEMSGRQDSVYRWKGRLLSYDGIGLDPITRTVPVRVVVDNPTEYIDENGAAKSFGGGTALVRGMFVRVQLLIQPQTRLVVIPARALQPGNRVLQFVPDESVLTATRNVSGSDSGDGLASEPASEASPGRTVQTVNQEGENTGFNAKDWTPGRVFVRKSVHPVDSLTIEDTTQRSNSGFAGSHRLWVCETRDSDLQSGSYVVVSPLGTIDDGELPVRADRDGIPKAPEQLQSEDSADTASAIDSRRLGSTRTAAINSAEDAG